MSEYFSELNEWDLRIQKVRLIVLLPKFASALCNPVEFISMRVEVEQCMILHLRHSPFSLWQLGGIE